MGCRRSGGRKFFAEVLRIPVPQGTATAWHSTLTFRDVTALHTAPTWGRPPKLGPDAELRLLQHRMIHATESAVCERPHRKV